jgi:hypothetical protein
MSSHTLTSKLGGTNHQIDLQNPDNLGQQSTDNGVVPNLKWSFSDSKTRILNGGWAREQVVTDLPSSHDISAAQQHLTKGSIRELHWHRVVRSLVLPFPVASLIFVLGRMGLRLRWIGPGFGSG